MGNSASKMYVYVMSTEGKRSFYVADGCLIHKKVSTS